MKYFVKYIPVEEDIKLPCVILSSDGYFDELTDSSTIQNTDKLAKLFLCSRDVKEGDPLLLDENQDYFKIIGEISKDASWIKEGMTFEEESIKKFAEVELTQGFWYIEWNKERENLGYKCIVRIKCPTCKFFH